MDRSKTRPERGFRPNTEAAEGRLLLSAGAGGGAVRAALTNPPGVHAVRPNTPVLPFGAPIATATFLDPAARILNGDHVVVGQRSFVGPYATLNGTSGFIKIGSGSSVLDNANLIPNPNPPARGAAPVILRVGDSVQVGFGATVLGDSVVGAYGAAAQPTGVGANALVDNAVVSPGAVVGSLARVGPGVVVPSGVYVLPGSNVTTTAEATDPALGQVVPLPASVRTDLRTELTRNVALAAGYTTLYQGNSATGANPGVEGTASSSVFNGNLAAVRGANFQPGPASLAAPTGINFEPSRSSPRFPSPHQGLVQSVLPNFRARVTGDSRFEARAKQVAHRLGQGNAFRADQGQPIQFASAPSTGRAVTINSPLGGSALSGGTEGTIASTPPGTTLVTLVGATTRTFGTLNFGRNFRADDGAVILGGPAPSYTVGDDVTVGSYAVVDRSSVGSGAVIGARSFVFDSTVAPGRVIEPGTILIQNKVVGRIQW